MVDTIVSYKNEMVDESSYHKVEALRIFIQVPRLSFVGNHVAFHDDQQRLIR